MKDPEAAEPVSVRLLALPETTPTALYGCQEAFSAIGSAWTSLTGEPVGTVAADVRVVARDVAPFACAGGGIIAPRTSLAEAGAADIVIVTDLGLGQDTDPRGRWPEAAAWLRERFDGGATVCSVCTGSILLADAGLLDGWEATTHWGARPLFETFYPRVKLLLEHVLLATGPDHRIVTSGGTGSWEDLVLYLITRFWGQAEAVRTAKVFLIGDRSEGQLPFAPMRRARRHDDAVIGRCQAWIASNYMLDNPVARMTAHSGLTERTFKRRFKSATDYAPVEYVQALRVEEAKQMLETSSYPTDEIAHLVGYEDIRFFRQVFRRVTGTTPARYRRRFQSAIGPRTV